jgi:hypothetical protein
MRHVCAAVVLIAGILSGGCARQTSHVTVTFESCGRITHDDVSIITIPSGKIAGGGKMSAAGNGVERFAADVAPGYYSIVAGVLPCSARRDIAAIAGKDRSVTMRGQDQLDLGDGGALVGTVSTGQAAVRADCFDPVDRWLHYNADVQDGIFYFDNIRAPARCKVTSENGAGRGWSNVRVVPFAVVRM